MQSAKLSILLFVGSLLVLPAIVVKASDPVGVYCVIDRVIFEPNETSPQRIQVWGTFSLWEGKPGDGNRYSSPQRGYLYYKIAASSDGKVERTEWNDLKAIAGTGQGVAFGQRYRSAGNVRQAAVKPESPDDYPIGLGLTKVGFGASYGSDPENMKRVIDEIKKAKAGGKG